jgi:integrase
MWWITALFTGGRKGSIEALRWNDLDFTRKMIRFRVTKGDRPYAIPMADKLAELFAEYRDSGEVPPSEWVFPSQVHDGAHIVAVKNDKEGVPPAHRLRHTYRTMLARLGAPTDHARMLLGHAKPKGDPSPNYITDRHVVEALRPLANQVAAHYVRALGWE